MAIFTTFLDHEIKPQEVCTETLSVVGRHEFHEDHPEGRLHTLLQGLDRNSEEECRGRQPTMLSDCWGRDPLDGSTAGRESELVARSPPSEEVPCQAEPWATSGSC